MRYFFNSPSLWAYEISLFLYGAYIVARGAYTHLDRRPCQCRHHLGPALLRDGRYSSPHQRLRVSLLGVLFWVSLKLTINSWDRRDHDVALEAHLLSAAHDAAGGCFLFLMQVLAKLDPRCADLIKGEDVFPVRVQVP